MIYYYKCLRLLLFPHLTSADIDPDILRKCAEACSGVCSTYKNLHRETSVRFSLMALYSAFLSGLTVLYCLWLSPSEIYNISTSNDLNACSIVLYVITERWPGARKYRDVFESIRQCVLNLIEEGENGSAGKRVPLIKLREDSELRDMVRGVQRLHPEGRAEFSRMMSDMVGDAQPLSSHSRMAIQQNTDQVFDTSSGYSMGQSLRNPETIWEWKWKRYVPISTDGGKWDRHGSDR